MSLDEGQVQRIKKLSGQNNFPGHNYATKSRKSSNNCDNRRNRANKQMKSQKIQKKLAI